MLLPTTSVIAAEYQSFSDVSYSRFDAKHSHSNFYGVSTRYFLDKRASLGPLNEFEYINTISNVSGHYSHSDNSDRYNVAGELFLNDFVIGGGYSYTDYDSSFINDSEKHYNANLGYLISENFIVHANAGKVDGGKTNYNFSSSYNHQLNDKDYIGFTFNTDDDFDYRHLSSKYYKSLEGGQYLTLGLNYQNHRDSDNYLSGNINFYFNEKTSVFAGYDNYTFGAEYFFNNNYSLNARYQSNASSHLSDLDIYSVNFTAQF
ncbi:putative porin [Pseudoalteromonas denitrificans]|uniref:Putative general porin n=1 Tax=Pseudoalteromonas denitrificans DSM 6059 TaxID=1123010 RepID=A0A1I1TRM9_9GAMM|nr:putative porin [Pseudoalteromonas denitrificans]SFD61035.1 Putative general porin [Pseudoalteromonas denitrificans DSM 6059]